MTTGQGERERGADTATAQAWAALGGDPGLVERVRYRGDGGLDGGRLPVRELARATVGVCSLAAAELAAVRADRRPVDAVPELEVAEGAVATAFVSERHLRIAGRAAESFAPLSGFWRTADGWLRTHANYPHHRERLLAALGLPAGAGPEDLRAELAGRAAVEVQERVYAAGGLAVAVTRGYGTPRPLVTWGPEPDPEPEAGSGWRAGAGGGGPAAAGVRVLDLTRVIAGPVATRTLGLLGADVLRVDPPGLPESDDAHADTGFGKRSARLDLARAGDRAVFEELLAGADVVVTGYRPGALDRFGLSAAELLARRPGLVVAELSAWGGTGEWAGRRGFDSLVQAGYGIAMAEADAAGTPGVLPAQALDHGTGYLAAAAVLRALAAGGGRAVRLSLAGTASWLVREVPSVPAAGASYRPEPWLATADSDYGPLRHALPPLAGAPRDWPRGPSRWGTDAPAWS
ncbi:CoA transferase [Streptomyces sp. NPDC089919]|uniref:CoA transferase n=1 Tax=Streptomyces sp. NPDC089919 TaxID=3155188 RepID=UPI003437F00D